MKDGKLFMSYGVMGGDMQTQGHVQVLSAMIDLGLDVQHAIEMPRFRYAGARGVMMETEMGAGVIEKLKARGHTGLPAPRSSMGGGQAIVVDFATGALMGGSDVRKDGMALGY